MRKMPSPVAAGEGDERKTMNQIIPFTFESTELRTLTLDGEPWFVAKDVCNILGLGNVGQALIALDNDEKNSIIINDGNRGNPNKAIISESGLYSLILRPRKPGAKTFKRWITHEVIPSIRKTGSYGTPQLSGPALYLAAIEQAQSEIAALEAAREKDKRKVLFADSVAASHTSILVGELAKILKGNGVNIGGTRLFAELRRDGFLIKREGTDRNMPTQYAMERGLFEIKETVVTHSDGHVTISKTPKVTGRGQQYFIDRYLSQSDMNPEEIEVA